MKTSIQFHATNFDFFEFVSEMKNKDYKICGIKLFPGFELKMDFKELKPIDINDMDMIFISKSNIPIADNYKEFIAKQDGNLGITVGKESDGKLLESAMWMFTESEFDPDLKKIMTAFKKRMIRGAWLKSPINNTKTYFKNHLYTLNAKLAYENGVTICPIAGWNVYELKNEQ